MRSKILCRLETYPLIAPVRFLLHGILAFLISSLGAVNACAASSSESNDQPPTCMLIGNDARRAGELDSAVEAALDADHWDDAIASAEELLRLRTRVHGSKYFETLNAEWRLWTLHRLAAMPTEDQRRLSVGHVDDSAWGRFLCEGKNAEAKPLFEKALEIRGGCQGRASAYRPSLQRRGSQPRHRGGSRTGTGLP